MFMYMFSVHVIKCVSPKEIPLTVFQVLVEHEGAVNCASITEANRHVLSGSDDHRLLVWNLNTGLVEQRLTGHTGPVTSVQTTNDGGIAISGRSFIKSVQNSQNMHYVLLFI